MTASFLDMLGAPKTDLRKKYHCAICGIRVTKKNFGMSSTAWGNGGWGRVEVYCHECFLKPEALKAGGG